MKGAVLIIAINTISYCVIRFEGNSFEIVFPISLLSNENFLFIFYPAFFIFNTVRKTLNFNPAGLIVSKQLERRDFVASE